MQTYIERTENDGGCESKKGFIGILCWGEGENPAGMIQLESMPNHINNPRSFAFPVRYVRIPGANFETVVRRPSSSIRQRMIEAALELEDEGACVIATSCGFNVIHHRSLAAAVEIPVCSSSLLLVPLLQTLLGPEGGVGVLTANSRALTATHLSAAGITPEMRVEVIGIEHTSEWRAIHSDFNRPVDKELFACEVTATAKHFIAACPSIHALVLECTDLSPLRNDIQTTCHVAVYDIFSLLRCVFSPLSYGVDIGRGL